jgi:hypothetical protein
MLWPGKPEAVRETRFVLSACRNACMNASVAGIRQASSYSPSGVD